MFRNFAYINIVIIIVIVISSLNVEYQGDVQHLSTLDSGG